MSASKPKIYWRLKDDGRSNEEIVANIKGQGFGLPDTVEQIVAKMNEPVPSEETTYELVGIEGDRFPTREKRTTSAVLKMAAKLKYRKPPLRAGLLLRDMLTQDELDYARVIVMNEPIEAKNLYKCVLVLEGPGWPMYDNLLTTELVDSDLDEQWGRENLFLFLAPL